MLDESLRKKDAEIIGYAAYMELVNGFHHALYWPKKQVDAHSQRFSQAVKKKKTDSPWFTNCSTTTPSKTNGDDAIPVSAPALG